MLSFAIFTKDWKCRTFLLVRETDRIPSLIWFKIYFDDFLLQIWREFVHDLSRGHRIPLILSWKIASPPPNLERIWCYLVASSSSKYGEHLSLTFPGVTELLWCYLERCFLSCWILGVSHSQHKPVGHFHFPSYLYNLRQVNILSFVSLPPFSLYSALNLF